MTRVRRVLRRLAKATLMVVGAVIALVLLVAVVLAFGVVVAGEGFQVSSGLQDAGGDVVEPLPPVPAVSLPPGHRVYVALGDSYSSGEGVRPYLPGSGDRADGGDRCHRSTDAYSQQIKFREHVQIRFRACSGARIKDMYKTQKTAAGRASLGPQLQDGVLGPKVGLVTLTIGGNDIGFVRVLSFCMANHPKFLHLIPRPLGNCMKEEFNDRFDDGKRSGLTLDVWGRRKMSELKPQVQSLFERLRAEAPNARIIVLGYPNIFWTQFGGGMGQFDKDCILDALTVSNSETNGILRFESDFNGMVERTAYKSGVVFISTTSTFLGHEPCGRLSPRWMDYIVLGGGEAGRLDPGSMHPNRNGHYVLARLISCYLSIPLNVRTYDPDRLSDCARYGKTPVAGG